MGLAEATLEKIIQDISEEKESTELFNPKDWFLISWPFGGGVNLQTCEDKSWVNCLCMCRSSAGLSGSSPDPQTCLNSKTSICVESSGERIPKTNGPINIDNVPLTISFEYRNGEVLITEK